MAERLVVVKGDAASSRDAAIHCLRDLNALAASAQQVAAQHAATAVAAAQNASAAAAAACNATV